MNRSRWRNAFHDQVPRALRELRAERLRDDIESRLQLELVERTTSAFAAGFHSGCPFPGARTDDYKQRELQLPGGEWALIGIRVHYFEKFPFVDVVATTAPVDARSIPGLFDTAVAACGVFRPKVVRVLASPGPLSVPGFSVELDQVIVAGPTLAAHEPSVDVVVTPVESADAAAGFVRHAYLDFFEVHPEFETIIDPSDLGAIQSCIETGLATWVRIGGERAGFIASQAQMGPLVGGQSMNEEILSAPFRGQGFGAAAQRAFLAALHGRVGDEVVWGTIDWRNPASVVTARRSGRPEQAGWHWVRRLDNKP